MLEHSIIQIPMLEEDLRNQKSRLQDSVQRIVGFEAVKTTAEQRIKLLEAAIAALKELGHV